MRFPESSSRATGFRTVRDVFVDQIVPLVSFRRTKSPGSTTLSVPDVFVSGVALFATQTTVVAVTFLYHMPM